jgi:hypothetical protein
MYLDITFCERPYLIIRDLRRVQTSDVLQYLRLVWWRTPVPQGGLMTHSSTSGWFDDGLQYLRVVWWRLSIPQGGLMTPSSTPGWFDNGLLQLRMLSRRPPTAQGAFMTPPTGQGAFLMASRSSVQIQQLGYRVANISLFVHSSPVNIHVFTFNGAHLVNTLILAIWESRFVFYSKLWVRMVTDMYSPGTQ